MTLKKEFQAFDQQIIIRVQESTKMQLQQLVNHNKNIMNISHACRIAVLHYLKENQISKKTRKEIRITYRRLVKLQNGYQDPKIK